jgi:ubiquinone/menaquinone biosynthesis C-methylase UbiE
MLAQARGLNPGIPFRDGNMLALDFGDSSLAGITTFYSIVNIPEASLPQVFREMTRVLQPDGQLLLAFHLGNDVLQPAELWNRPISMNFYLYPVSTVRRLIETAGLTIEEVLEREPYAPEVEHQSRRAYIFARKPAQPTPA